MTALVWIRESLHVIIYLFIFTLNLVSGAESINLSVIYNCVLALDYTRHGLKNIWSCACLGYIIFICDMWHENVTFRFGMSEGGRSIKS
jgi:hypothetical protein